VEEALRLKDREFQQLRSLVYDMFGINLTEQKRALVLGRLGKVLREKSFTNFEQYLDYVTNDKSGEAISTLIDRISTNHTFFYRESDHFDHFLSVCLPEWIQRKQQAGDRKLRIWVAGCSSGEESYMLSMLLHEALGREIRNWDVGILATDISITSLEKAVNGVYSEENARHLPPTLRHKYMIDQRDGTYVVHPNLKNLVTHRKLNLMNRSYPFRGLFQFIFCRNVMIYFDRPTREALVRRFHQYTESAGYLFIGHSETLGRSNELFQYIRPAVYRKESR